MSIELDPNYPGPPTAPPGWQHPRNSVPVTNPTINTDIGGTVVAQPASVPDRAFRDAWSLNGQVVEIDMATARAVWRNALTAAVALELEGLEQETIQALLDNTDTTAIQTRRTELNGAIANPAIDTASNLTELRDAKPSGLVVPGFE